MDGRRLIAALVLLASIGGLAARGVAADRVLWQVAGLGLGSPGVSADTAFFLSTLHGVVAVSRRDGRVRWKAATGEKGRRTSGARVLVVGDVVIAGDYNVHAFSAQDGARRWRFEPRLGHAPGTQLGAAYEGVIFAGSGSGHVYAIAAADGGLVWSASIDTGAVTVMPPVVSHELVCAGHSRLEPPFGGGVTCFERTTGTRRWQHAFSPDHAPVLFGGGLAIDGSRVIASGSDGVVYVLDAASGRIMSRLAASELMLKLEGRDQRPVIATGGRIIVGSRSGEVVAYDAVTLARLWRQPADGRGSVATRLAAGAGTIVVPYVSGRLLALEARTGAIRWETAPETAGFYWAPEMAEDTMYVANLRHGFFAFTLR